MTTVSPTRTSLSTVSGNMSPWWWVELFTSCETASVIGVPVLSVSEPSAAIVGAGAAAGMAAGVVAGAWAAWAAEVMAGCAKATPDTGVAMSAAMAAPVMNFLIISPSAYGRTPCVGGNYQE